MIVCNVPLGHHAVSIAARISQHVYTCLLHVHVKYTSNWSICMLRHDVSIDDLPAHPSDGSVSIVTVGNMTLLLSSVDGVGYGLPVDSEKRGVGGSRG